MTVLLETERLVLRRFTPDDLDALVALHNDPEVMFFINAGAPSPSDEVNDFLEPLPRPVRTRGRLRHLRRSREVD